MYIMNINITYMRKRENKKVELKIQQQSDNEEQSVSVRTGNHNVGKNIRQQNSLSQLTKKFIELIKRSQNATIDLNFAVETLKVQKRRIYDITNVLQGINYVQKLHKNTIRWIGSEQDSQTEREIIQTRKKLEEMNQKQKELNQSIESLNNQIKKEFLDNEEMRKYHYITYQDLGNIYKSISGGDQSKSLIVISAPKGTSLEIGQQQSGNSILRMQANSGAIRVLKCNASGEVQEVTAGDKDQ